MVAFQTELADACALALLLSDAHTTEARQLFLRLPAAAAVIDETTGVDANARWRALFGSAPELPPWIATACAPLSQGAHVVELANLEIAHAGQVRHVALHARTGTQRGVIVACRDVTDDVVGRDLGVAARTVVWGGSVPGVADYYSASWRASSVVPEHHWLDAFHPEDRPRCCAAVGEAGRLRESQAVEARIRGLDGHARWYRVQLCVRPDGRWFGTAVDIHDASMAEERSELLEAARCARADAELANRLKDEFLAVVSHELRTPVATLLLWEKVLRDGTLNAAAHAQALDAIHQSALAQSRLVADLLDVSRAITGKLHIDTRTVHIEQTVRDAVTAVAPYAAEKGVELHTRWPGDNPEVLGDATRLRQVLDNVLSNAIKFTPSGGVVTIELQRNSNAVEIVVTDTGRGISPDLLAHIFEPFSQRFTRRDGGLGLELAIAHSIVALHGGQMRAFSAGPGRGTTITVSLPAPSGPTASPQPGRRHVLTLSGVRVLLVDDDARVCDALALLLVRAGAAVRTAQSAAAARAVLASEPADVIVCDVAMAEEDGFSFVRSLRATDAATPVIALTAFAADAYAARALESGFNRHIAKPIHVERLITCIKELHASREDSQIA